VAPARTAPPTYRWQAAHVEGGLNAAADQQSFLVNGVSHSWIGWPAGSLAATSRASVEGAQDQEVESPS
jgi:hypothetical protein